MPRLHIATLCHYTEHDDITMQSTSLEWIFSYLKRHYGLETKGANFLKLSDHVFKTGTPYQTFYKQYRASFLDNLRKAGDIVKYKNDQPLAVDEQLSPSFESAIVLWSLEKIDPRLPARVKKNYGHQMVGNVTLRDIQPQIFENISAMLSELDSESNTRAIASLSTSDDTSFNAINFRDRRGSMFQGNRQQRGLGRQQRGSERQQRGGHGTQARGGGQRTYTSGGGRTTGVTITDKYCRMCDLAGSDPRIYTSHEIGNCSRLTIADMQSLRNALVLNGLFVEEDEEEEPSEPEYHLQPGWDDEEAAQLNTDQPQ